MLSQSAILDGIVMSCAKLFLLPFLVFVCIVWQNEFNDMNITLATIMIVIGTIDQHYTTHICTCTYQCLLHCHPLNSLFTFPKFFLLPLHYYCYQSGWSAPVMLCNNCCLQSTLCLWLWLVLTFGYVLLYNNCPHSRHNVLLLLNILYHHYWASLCLTFKQNVQLRYSPLVTHMYMHTHVLTHITHTYTRM